MSGLNVGEGLVAGQDALSHVDTGEEPGPRAGGEDAMLELQGLHPLLGFDFQTVRIRQTAPADHKIDFILLEQLRDALGEFFHHPLFPSLHRRQIEAKNPSLIKEVFQPKKVLDLGCGPGALMHLLWEIGVSAEGIDFAESSPGLATPEVRDRITIGQVTDPTLKPANAYDLVICREVLEHLTVLQVRQAVANMVRMTSRYVYVTTRFHPNPSSLLDFTTQFDVDPTHITLLNKELLRVLFVLEGFRSRPDLEERWNAWYSGPKLAQMLTNPGFLSCQRFMRAAGTGRDYLALSDDDARQLGLTDTGRRAAERTFRRHALAEWLLTEVVGLGWAEADEEAHHLQHALSERVTDKIDELLGLPPTCPHGNPIPRDGRTPARPEGSRLSEAEHGAEVTILRVTEEAEEDARLLRFLQEHGIRPGSVFEVVEVAEHIGTMTLRAVGSRTTDQTATLGLVAAAKIRMLRGRSDPSLFHRVPERARLAGE